MMEIDDMTEQAGSSVDRVRAVYDSDHARLWRSLLAFAGSRDVADEAAAEAFAQAIRRGDELRDVRAWVWRSAFAIARGLLSDRQPLEVRDGADSAHLETDAVELSDVLDALATLSESDRELLVLCHVGGWTPAALAPLLGVRRGALRVRLHRATKRARVLLQEDQI